MNASAVERFLGDYQARAPELPARDTDWLAELRRLGRERFEEVGLPGPRDEQWKYTRIAPIEKRDFRAPAPVELGAADIEPFLIQGLQCRRLVFVDGRYAEALSAPGADRPGVTLGSLARVLAAEPERVRGHLGRYAEASRNGFTALNTAFINDGAFIHLGRNAVLDEPVHLLFLSTEAGGEFSAYPRNLVVAEEGSAAKVIESYAALGEGRYLNDVTSEVVLEANAELEHYLLQEESRKAFHVATVQVHQARDARYRSHAVAFGAQLARTDINAVLDGEGAQCHLAGLYMVDGRQHVDFHTTVDHARPHGTSREFYKGILDGRARGVFNGRVHVHPHAQKTDSEQSNKNLLLSRDAEVDTKPELEIYADDVKCSHGATVGQLDENMLFYLRARGIDKEAARGLLTYGFAQDVIDGMSLEPVREHLEQRLVTRVPDAEHVAELV